MGDIALFVSHAHADADIAVSLVRLIETTMVRKGGILCTSHPKQEYREPIGADLSEHLREHLREASCVVAVLTPHSLNSQWCLFELGAAWARATKTYPLLAGGLTPESLPAALKGRVCGRLGDRQDLRHLLAELRAQLGWDERNMESAARQIDQLVTLVHRRRWPSVRLGQASVPSRTNTRARGSLTAISAVLGLLAAAVLVKSQVRGGGAGVDR